MRKATTTPTIFEYIFAVCVLIYYSSAFATLLKGTDELPTGVNTGFLLTNSLFSVSYATGAYLLSRRCNLDIQILRHIRWLLMATLLPVVSVLWSDVPWITTLHATALIGTTVVGVYLGLRYDFLTLLRLLGWSLGTCAVLSFLAGWLFPTYGTGSGVFEGDWIGVFAHKNTLGSVMGLGFVAFLMLEQASQEKKLFLWSLCFLCGALVFLADSATSKLACGFVVVLVFYDAVVRPRVKHGVSHVPIISSLVCVAAWLLYAHFEDIFGVLGRNENLTGRLMVWSLVWPMVQEKMLMGYGYGGFWLGIDGPSADVWKVFGERSWYNAHNGYLEIWTGCGLVGVMLFALCMTAALRSAFAHLRNNPTAASRWPLCLLLFLAVHNFGEATFLLMNHIFWLVFVAVVVQLDTVGGASMPERHLASVPMEPQFQAREAVGF